jgi:multidrug efflux pump subunit AcrB
VDDAVVVGENIYSERERGRSGLGAAIAGAQRVKVPVVFAVATTIVAFSPLLAVGGTIGKVLSDIPLVVIAVLSLSLVEALLILPFHLSHLPAAGTHTTNKFRARLEAVQRGFDRYLQNFIDGPLDRGLKLAVNMPYLVLAGAVALLIVVGALVPAGIIKVQFFPEIEADVVAASIEMPAGTSIERTALVTDRIEQAAERALSRFSDEEEGHDDIFEASYTTIGLIASGANPINNNQTLQSNVANVQIGLIPSAERDFTATEFEQAWREEMGQISEARSISISSSLISAGAPVNVRVSHPDREVLEEATSRLMVELGKVAGTYDVESDQDDGVRQVDLTLKPSARTLGITLQDLAGQVRAAFFGAEAVRVQRGREDVRVYVRLPEDQRDSVPDIGNYRVRVPGGQVPLSSLADISITNAPTSIQREDGFRIHTVTADLDTDVVTSQEMATLLEGELLPAIAADYPELQFEFGGEQEQQQESFGDIGGAFLLALAGIYALLAIPFRSYVQPFVIMAAIPFGAIGALIGHLLLGISLGIVSMFGIIALSGVVINGGLVLIDFMNENLENGMERKAAIIDAAKSRFRPIILTAITTFLGVAPITFETNLQAQFLIPMSASLGFGILFGTLMQQLLVPALAILQMRAVDRFKRWFGRGEDQPGELAGASS